MFLEATETWPMMSSLWPAIIMTVLYVLTVELIGPKYMSFKQPKELTSTIIIYNGIQILLCCWWLYKAGEFIQNVSINEIIGAVLECTPLSPSKELAGRKLMYFYHLMKLTEFIETVFFVLRKKQNQVSFLHVYHHSSMVIAAWFYVKYIQCFMGLLGASMNTLVHVVMYSYYLLASMGPSVRPYLWWKKYLTGFQIVQFLYLIVLHSLIGVNQCNIQWPVTALNIGIPMVFLVLFSMFYNENYLSKIKDKKAQL